MTLHLNKHESPSAKEWCDLSMVEVYSVENHLSWEINSRAGRQTTKDLSIKDRQYMGKPLSIRRKNPNNQPINQFIITIQRERRKLYIFSKHNIHIRNNLECGL